MEHFTPVAFAGRAVAVKLSPGSSGILAFLALSRDLVPLSPWTTA